MGLWRRLAASALESEAADLRDVTAVMGATATCDCHVGEFACVYGSIRSLTIRPDSKTPVTEAEVWDGAGAMSLVWMGRSSIPGISLGQTIMAVGRVARGAAQDSLVMYNPRYQLIPRA